MFLSDRKILITGLLSERSIAYGVAKACYEQGAKLVFSYQPQFKNRVEKLILEFDGALGIPCDVTSDEDIDVLCEQVQAHCGHLDGLLHSIAFADKSLISGDFISGVTREAFLKSMDISVYSLVALTQALEPLMSDTASIVTLSYMGAKKAVPNYNMMGVAKAGLESGVRYLAQNLGARGIRVNGISSGVIKTLASSGIQDFSKMLNYVEKVTPLQRNVTQIEVGQVAAFLFSSLSSAVTGQIIYVDAGFSSIMPVDIKD